MDHMRPVDGAPTEAIGAPPVMRARLAMWAIGAVVVVDAVIAGIAVQVGRVIRVQQSFPIGVDPDDADRVVVAAETAALAAVAVFAVAVVLFLVWFRAAYGLAKRRTPDLGTHGVGWSIGAWFVPFLNLVRPKKMMDDLWVMAESDARHRAGERAYPIAPPLVAWWWGAWLVGSVVGQYASALWLLVVALVAEVMGGILVIWLIRQITAHQRSASDGANSVYGKAPSHAPTSYLAPVGLVAGALVAFGTPFALFTIHVDESFPAARRAGGVVVEAGVLDSENLEVGDCLLGMAEVGGTLAVDVVPCDLPRLSQVHSVMRIPQAPSARYPGDRVVIAQADDLCTSGLRSALRFAEVDMDEFLEEHGQDHISPSAGSWTWGDRRLVCLVYRLDGDVMVDEPLHFEPLAGFR